MAATPLIGGSALGSASDARVVTTPPRCDAVGGAGDAPLRREHRRDTALRVPLLYLQVATLPPVDWVGVHTIGANFSLVPYSWLKSHAHIERDRTADDVRLHDSSSGAPQVFVRHKYSVSTLLTVDNPLPADVVLFKISSTAPANDSEANEDDVVRVLAGERKVAGLDALAAWLHGLRIARHIPDAPEAVLRGMKPSQISITMTE